MNGLAITSLIKAVITALVATATMYHATPARAVCALSQPVFIGTVQVGEWYAVLTPGQHIVLPDSDTAYCLAGGELDVR